MDGSSNRRGFRWTPRETDLTRHVNVAGYLERGEKALADVGRVDLADIDGVRLWFRRPAFVGDQMFTQVDLEADPLLVDLRRRDDEELCAALAFVR